MEIIRYNRVTSTNALAKRLADNNAGEWTVVVSEAQTKGKGRAGHSWISPKGGLWFSIILRPRIDADKIPLIQFLAANGLRQAVDQATGLSSQVKWPNDLVMSGKKLAGILIETRIDGKVVYAVIGIGLNVNMTDKMLPSGAVSLFTATDQKFDLEDILDLILEALEKCYKKLDDNEAIMREWWDHCVHRLRPVMIRTPTGIVSGKCVGVKGDGSIVIRRGTVEESISEGSLILTD